MQRINPSTHATHVAGKPVGRLRPPERIWVSPPPPPSVEQPPRSTKEDDIGHGWPTAGVFAVSTVVLVVALVMQTDHVSRMRGLLHSSQELNADRDTVTVTVPAPPSSQAAAGCEKASRVTDDDQRKTREDIVVDQNTAGVTVMGRFNTLTIRAGVRVGRLVMCGTSAALVMEEGATVEGGFMDGEPCAIYGDPATYQPLVADRCATLPLYALPR